MARPNSDDDPEELPRCYSVGWDGEYPTLYPIYFWREDGKYFFRPWELAAEGPYDSLGEALDAAEFHFHGDDGGFWKTREEAEKHRDRLLGYDV